MQIRPVLWFSSLVAVGLLTGCYNLTLVLYMGDAGQDVGTSSGNGGGAADAVGTGGATAMGTGGAGRRRCADCHRCHTLRWNYGDGRGWAQAASTRRLPQVPQVRAELPMPAASEALTGTGGTSGFGGTMNAGGAVGLGGVVATGGVVGAGGVVGTGGVAGTGGIIGTGGTVDTGGTIVPELTVLAGVPSLVGSADGTGASARFNWPMGVTVDGSGNVFVADWGNNTIRKITPTGVVTTLAGTAVSLGSADGTGASARFNSPHSVAVDGSGNVFVADWGNNTIRNITPTGAATTLAGTAGSSGSADGTGAAARFNGPIGVAVDVSGNVFVADSANNTIRKITTAGVVTTIAGTAGLSGSADGTGSAARFHAPTGVAVDGEDNVFVADMDNWTIRNMTSAGVVTTLAGSAGSYGSADGTGAAARFISPWGVAVDGAGNFFVADVGNNTIREITPTGVVTTLAGTAVSPGSADGTGASARFNDLYGVAVDGAGNVFVADTVNNTIRK